MPKDFIGREPYFLLSFYEYHKSVRTHIVCDAQTKQNVKHGRDLIAADVCTILIHVFDHAQVDT